MASLETGTIRDRGGAMDDKDMQLAKVVELFTKFSKDGMVPTASLQRILCSCVPLSETDVARLVEAMDTQKSGKVPLQHFISWMFRSFEDQIEEWKTDAELENFTSILPEGLQKLGLSFVDPDKFTDHGFGLIGAGLPVTLKTLALAFEFSWTECKISKDGFGKLVAGLPKGLTSLDLSIHNDELGDEALKLLAEVMPPTMSRVVLHFKDNDSFSDTGLCALISSLPSSLTELSLNFDANGQLSDATLTTLAIWLRDTGKALQKLQFIGNSSPKITENGLHDLCSALPKMKQLRLEFQSSDAADLPGHFITKQEEFVVFVPH